MFNIRIIKARGICFKIVSQEQSWIDAALFEHFVFDKVVDSMIGIIMFTKILSSHKAQR